MLTLQETRGPGAHRSCVRLLSRVGHRRADRTWPTPRATRHAWVHVHGGPPRPAPVQGFVIEWRRHNYRWWANVLFVEQDADDRPAARTRWVEVDSLTPVRSDPSGGRFRHSS